MTAKVDSQMASTIVIITFDEMEKAGQVLESVHSLEKENLIVLKDAAVVVKDESGKVKAKETGDVSTRRGVITGGSLGLIIGIVLGGPVGGLVVGGLLGAFTAKKIDLGISNEKIKSVTADMQKGTSALFLQVEKVDKKEWLIALVRDSGGKVAEIDLADEAEIAVDEHLADYTARH